MEFCPDTTRPLADWRDSSRSPRLFASARRDNRFGEPKFAQERVVGRARGSGLNMPTPHNLYELFFCD
jgi:hypothetical protein